MTTSIILGIGSSRVEAENGPADLTALESTGAATHSRIHGVLISTVPVTDKDTGVTHYFTTTFNPGQTFDARTTKRITAGDNHRAAEYAAGSWFYQIVEVPDAEVPCLGEENNAPLYVAVSYRNYHEAPYIRHILCWVSQAQGLPRVGERLYSDDLCWRYADTREACERLIQEHIINHPIS
jgi:hypothetical protein